MTLSALSQRQERTITGPIVIDDARELLAILARVKRLGESGPIAFQTSHRTELCFEAAVVHSRSGCSRTAPWVMGVMALR